MIIPSFSFRQFHQEPGKVGLGHPSQHLEPPGILVQEPDHRQAVDFVVHEPAGRRSRRNQP